MDSYTSSGGANAETEPIPGGCNRSGAFAAGCNHTNAAANNVECSADEFVFQLRSSDLSNPLGGQTYDACESTHERLPSCLYDEIDCEVIGCHGAVQEAVGIGVSSVDVANVDSDNHAGNNMSTKVPTNYRSSALLSLFQLLWLSIVFVVNWSCEGISSPYFMDGWVSPMSSACEEQRQTFALAASVRKVMRTRNDYQVGRRDDNGFALPVRPISVAEQIYEHRSVQSRLQQQRGQAMIQEKLRG